MQWLLQQSPRAVNATNISGRTPLHIAAQRNNVEMCEVLIDYGAFVNPLMVNAKVCLFVPFLWIFFIVLSVNPNSKNVVTLVSESCYGKGETQ